MMHQLPSPLPKADRCTLALVQTLVPATEREDWRHTWEAELWCLHHGRQAASLRVTADLFVGLALDAMWLRTESWRRALTGTPALCLTVLLGCCVLSMLAAWALDGSWPLTFTHLTHEAVRCLLAAPLVIFVTSVTASSRHIEASGTSKNYRGVRQIFFATKSGLALLLTFLLSADVCRPLSTGFPKAGLLLQVLCFVIFTIFALRWSFRDQEGRCKQCLRALATPARVGRPSHNLLEWNGTAQVCRLGHGMLSVPEMETSWCQYGQWFDQRPDAWDQPASV